jgi:hypothetical protein
MAKIKLQIRKLAMMKGRVRKSGLHRLVSDGAQTGLGAVR